MSNSESTPKISDGNINDWASALKGVNPDLAAALDEKRSVGFGNIEKLGLPRYKRKTMDVKDFLDNPAGALSDMQSDLFYITVLPKKEGLPRFGTSGLTAEQVLEYVSKNVGDAISDYSIVIQQFFENAYGGNIVISPDGNVHVEFKAGKQGAIAKGTHTPEFNVARNYLTNSFRYSFEDAALRETVYRTLQTIPHTGEGRELKWHPGYYEFILFNKDGKGLEPIFIDYRDNPAYQLPRQEA